MSSISAEIPFTYFVLKVASRCNLNCTYCYMYNLADQTWKQQPAFMSSKVINSLAVKIKDHCIKHKLKQISISLHGGEPLLGGIDYISKIVETLKNEVQKNAGIDIKFSLQTNGALLNMEWINALAELNIYIGFSMDGPSQAHDRYRVDHRNQGSYSSVIKAVNLLTNTEAGKKIFGSVLCVIDLENSPLDIYDHFLQLGLWNMDFLLPDHNYTHFPKNKVSFQHTPYADWLIKIFDKWYETDDSKINIRFFESIILGILGAGTGLDSIGAEPIGLAIIETDGGIEPLDVFKCTENGLTKLGINIVENEIDDLRNFHVIQMQLEPFDNLSPVCKACKYSLACGGGYLPHRYSGDKNFLNPSVYCADLYKLFKHIDNRINKTKKALKVL